ncbi:MAG: hypothetical protein LBC60_02100, partial [Spirochaetaceae bacterium]|nr:hypothetical protein [Spirochaetaceae bacterium]
MKRFLYLIIFFLPLFFGGKALFAAGTYACGTSLPPFSVPSARNAGMGGSHAAYTDDINSLFINPAALRTTSTFSATELSAGVYGDSRGLLRIMKAMGDTDALADALGSFVTNSNGAIPMGFDVRGPIALGNIKNGWGWGVFNRFYGGALATGRDLRIRANLDLMFNLGYAFRAVNIGVHTLDLGVMGKVYGRKTFDSGSVPLAELIAGKETLRSRFTPAPVTLGAGMDLGLQYRLAHNFTAGLVVQDFFSLGVVIPVDLNGTVTSSPYPDNIRPTVNIGLSYKLIDNSLFTWAVMADYRDLYNLFRQRVYGSRNGWLNLSLGTELILFKHIAFRAGMNEMLPTVGIGLDLVVFKVDAAFYGKELGNEP